MKLKKLVDDLKYGKEETVLAKYNLHGISRQCEEKFKGPFDGPQKPAFTILSP